MRRIRAVPSCYYPGDVSIEWKTAMTLLATSDHFAIFAEPSVPCFPPLVPCILLDLLFSLPIALD